jgi:putative endonuclease
MMVWFLYIIRCHDNNLYTGIATDVGRRFIEHEHGRGAKYLRGKGPLTLAFCKKTGNRSRALTLEYRVKRLSKAEKERIVVTQRLPVLPYGFKGKGKRPKGASHRTSPVTRKSR